MKACPHDNVALMPTVPASTLVTDPYRSSLGRLSKRSDLAVLALLIVFGAFVNAAGMITPVQAWEHGTLTIGMFVVTGVLVLPLAAVFTCGVFNWLAQPAEALSNVVRRFVFALVPIGFAMWLAHLLYHLAVFPNWLSSAQLLALDAGLLLTLYVAWRVAIQYAANVRSALSLVAPWIAVSCGLYAAGVWILFQPMQMRGMLH